MPDPRSRESLVTFACGVAVLVAMLAFVPVVTGGGWWWLSALLVCAALATAAGARRVGLPAAAAALVGAAVLPLVVAFVLAVGSDAASTSPVQAVDDAIASAFRQIYLDAVPAPGSVELAVLMALGAALVALAADLVTVGLRAPLAGVLVVVAVAIVPGKAFSTGTNGLLLVAVAAAALGIIAADRRRRGSVPRVAGLAAGGAVAVVVALVVQLVLPAPFASQAQAVSGPLIDSAANPLLRLGQDLRRGVTTPVLTYTSTGGAPVYLRLAVLEDFSGETWVPNGADGAPLGLGAAPQPAGLAPNVDRQVTTTTITPASALAIGDRLPLPYPAVSVSGVSGGFRWEQRGLTLTRFGSSELDRYRVTSDVVDTKPDQLRAASVSVPVGDQQSLELPPKVPSIIRRTADSWTKNARTPYDEALAIQNRLRGGSFSYDENTPAEQGYDGDGLGVIATFLTKKAGYCIHFASTMAVMARLVGIPARIVVGYQPGAAQSGTQERQVTSDDLHAWPELYFDGVGWVRFEPTPGRGAVPAYAPVPTASAGPAARESRAATPTPTVAPSSSAVTGPASRDRRHDAAGAVTRGGGIGLAVLVLLALPGLLRVLIRRRRIRRTGRDGAGLAWRELLDTATDLGSPIGRGRSPRVSEASLDALLGPAPDARTALGRIRGAYERQAYSPRPVPAAGDDVRAVVAALRARASAGRRVVAAVAPRSLAATLVPSRLAFRWSPSGSDGTGRAVRLGADRT